MDQKFSDVLKKLRKDKGLSQQELADSLYVTRATVSRWESGIRLPDVVMISRIARILDVDVNMLLAAAERTIMSKVTLPGSIMLAIISILPAFARNFGVNDQFASFYGGTSLLILVGVVLDTLQQIESYLLMRHYDGLMKTGRLTGRSGL